MDQDPTTQLLDSIRQAHEINLTSGDHKPAFQALLSILVSLTESEFGFLDEVQWHENGKPFKRSLALSDLTWDDESSEAFARLTEEELLFLDLNNLAGAPVLYREVVVSDDPPTDPRSGGVPDGHPPIRSFMGMPLFFAGELVGVAGIANRPGGYDRSLADWLQPFLSTCASAIVAKRRREEEERRIRDLEEAQQLVLATLNASAQSTFLMDTEGTILMANDTMARRMGLSVEDVLGEVVYDLLPPNLARSRRKAVHEAIRLRSPVEFDDVRGDIHFHHRIFPVLNAGGEVERVAVFGEDITARRMAEEAFHRQAQRYELVAKGAADAIWDWDVVKNRIHFSPRWKELRGFSPEEVGDRQEEWISGIHPDDRDRVLEAVERHFAGETEVFQEEYRIRCKDGSWKWVLDRGIALRNEDGQVVRMAGSESDITKEREALQALRNSKQRLLESNQLLFGILQHTHMQAVYLDPDLNFVWVNQAYADTCGRPPSFFPGKSYFDLFPHEENETIFRRVVDTGEPFFVEARAFEFPDQPERGTTYWDWSLIPVKDHSGGVTGLVFTLAEVTSRIKAEKEVERSRDRLRSLTARFEGVREEERAALARELHDDMGQALAAMRYDLEVVERELPEAHETLAHRIHSMIDVAEDSLDRVSNMVSDLRSPVLDMLGLDAAVETEVWEYQERWGGKISLVKETGELPDWSDRDKAIVSLLKEALMNVRRHAEARQVEVDFRSSEDSLRLEVSDDGVGIPEEVISHPSSFGLLGMQERVDRLGGRLSIERRGSGGTRIVAELPLTAPPR